MNRGEIRDKILRRLNENPDDPQFWSEDFINSLINEAYVHIIGRTLALEVSTSLSLIAYQHIYELASNCFVLHHMFYETTERVIHPLTWRKLQNHDQSWVDTTDSRPRYYIAIPPNKVFLYPAVTADETDAITYYYAKTPYGFTADTDIPGIPIIYHDALVEYPLAMALLNYRTDEAVKKATMYYGKYTEKMISLQELVNNRSYKLEQFSPRFG